MSITYGLTEETYSFGEDSRKSYGIAAYSDAEDDETAAVVLSIHGITSDKEKLSALIDTCNRLELSILHLSDIVEDFIS